MILKESNASGIAFGIIFAVGGAVIGYYLRETNPIIIWLGVAFVIIGVASMCFSSSITVDAKKTSRQILYQKKRLIGGSSATYAIVDVVRIETRKQWRMQAGAGSGNRADSMPRQVLVSQSVIVFKDGQELPLDHQRTASSTSLGPAVLMGGQGKEMAIATQVANFLGVPFQEIAPPNSGNGINIGRGPGGMQL